MVIKHTRPCDGHIAMLGCGLIGQSWTALFLFHGMTLRLGTPIPSRARR